MYESNVTKALRAILDASDRPLRVIEIGTSYGLQFRHLDGCDNLAEMVSIDPMYDWVPDLRPDDAFDESKVDCKKLYSWREHTAGMPVSLVVSKSADAAKSGAGLSGKFDVLLIDGCHHPADAVEADYWDFVPFLSDSHVVLFDDIDHGDPQIAADRVEQRLRDNGKTVCRDEFAGGKVRILKIRG